MVNFSSVDDIVVVCILIIVSVYCIYYAYNSWKSIKKNKNRNKNKGKSRPYPNCPDYWDSIGENKCQNNHKIGECRLDDDDDTIDFNSDIFTNPKTGNYMKCKWSKECHAPWEGIDDLCV